MPSDAPIPTVVPRVAAPLRQQAVEFLREAIATCRYRPGERMIERVLCTDLGVSRTVVREALRQLESEGLVEMVPQVGPIVHKVTPAEVRNLYAVRAALESLIAADCATNASADQLDLVRGELRKVVQVLQHSEDITAVLLAKDGLMAAMVTGSGNDVAGDLLRTIHTRVSQLRFATLQSPGRTPQTIAELEAVVAAITARDPEAAGAAARAHVQSAAAIAMKSFETMPDSA